MNKWAMSQSASYPTKLYVTTPLVSFLFRHMCTLCGLERNLFFFFFNQRGGKYKILHHVGEWSLTLLMEIYYPEDFSSNRNCAHMTI